jgi:hypothetical protein
MSRVSTRARDIYDIVLKCQTAELGTFRRDLECARVRKSKCGCAKQFPSAHQDAVKGTKVARYMLKTMKIRDLRAD